MWGNFWSGNGARCVARTRSVPIVTSSITTSKIYRHLFPREIRSWSPSPLERRRVVMGHCTAWSKARDFTSSTHMGEQRRVEGRVVELWRGLATSITGPSLIYIWWLSREIRQSCCWATPGVAPWKAETREVAPWKVKLERAPKRRWPFIFLTLADKWHLANFPTNISYASHNFSPNPTQPILQRNIS